MVDVGRLKEADRLLQRMAAAGLPPDVRAHNALLAGHARAANTAAMGRLMQRMVAAGVVPSAVTWNTLLDGYVRARDLEAARGVLAQAAAAEVALDTWSYTTLIKGYVQVCVGGGGGGAASELGSLVAYSHLGGCAGRLCTAVGLGCTCGSWHSWHRPWLAALPTCVHADPAWPGASAHWAACHPSVQAGKLAAAETVLGDMAAAGVRPNHVSFTTLIDGHVRAGDMAAAQRVLDAMLAAGEAPTTVTFNALLRGYAAKAAQAAAAVEAGAKLGGAGARSAAPAAAGGVVSAAAAAAADGRPAATAVADAEAPPASPLSAALQLLNDMQAQGVRPAADTFNTLMAAAVEVGEPGLALELHQRLRRAGLRPDALTFTTLIKVGRHGGGAPVQRGGRSTTERDRTLAWCAHVLPPAILPATREQSPSIHWQIPLSSRCHRHPLPS